MLVHVLACFFVTWVLTTSTFPLVAIPRERFISRWATWDASDDPEFVPDPKVSITDKPTNLFMRSLAYLAECVWCMGFWVTLAFYGILHAVGKVPFEVENVLATAAGVGLTGVLLGVVGSWERRG